ncbi:MAG: DEAD/DEAH box helicase [Myxococcota bacterium]
MPDLAAKLRAALGQVLFERGAVHAARARLAGRTGDEQRWVVTIPGAPSPFEVTLWPDDWACSCGADACPHAVAAVLGTPSEVVDVPKVTYRLARREQSLVLDRDAPAGALRTDSDTELNRVWAGWWGKPGAPRGLFAKALAALADCAVTLDGAPIRCSGEPVLPRAVVEDDGPGFRVRVVRASGIGEVFRDGVVRIDDVLRPIGEAALDVDQYNRLVRGVVFGPKDGWLLVSKFLPDLKKRLHVDVYTKRLPEVVDAKLRATVEVRFDGERLSVTPRMVYGDPPVARIERGELVRFGTKIPIRDQATEQRLRDLLSREGLAFDVTVEREGAGAAAWVNALGLFRDDVLAAAPGLRVRKARTIPRVTVDDLRVRFEGDADPAALIDAFEAGRSLVPLIDGGWAPLPREWLERHASVLAELLSARDREGRVARHAAPLLLDALEALDAEIPPDLAGLRALAGDFDKIPPAPLPPDLTATLRPYQKRGVDWIAWLRSVGMGGILADDMGLGKTVQCLAAIGGRTLVVAPTSVIRNWEAEARRFRPGLSVCVYHGPRRELDASELVVTSYAILRLDLERLQAIRWHTVILDEAQAIKNPESQAAVAARSLVADHRLAVTGTPVENRLEELWSAFHFVSPGLLGGRKEFKTRFSQPIEAGSRAARDALRKRIRPFVLRRLKQEVAPELPPRTDVVLRCVLSERERAVYESVRSLARADVAKLLEKHGMMQILEVLLRMRQAACHPALLPGQEAETSSKLELLMETLDEVLAEGHRALVFSQWTSMLDLVERKLTAPFVRLDGSTRDRAGVIAAFNADDGPPVFLLSLKAGGTGLNLTAADYVFHLDPWWNPAVEDQATDRAHRIGQTRPVVSCRLVAEDTVEERILELQERKREVARAALDEEALAKSLTREELLALFD